MKSHVGTLLLIPIAILVGIVVASMTNREEIDAHAEGLATRIAYDLLKYRQSCGVMPETLGELGSVIHGDTAFFGVPKSAVIRYGISSVPEGGEFIKLRYEDPAILGHGYRLLMEIELPLGNSSIKTDDGVTDK